jgi:hypothetical protein
VLETRHAVDEKDQQHRSGLFNSRGLLEKITPNLLTDHQLA